MTEREMLFLDRDLVEKIDRNRGDIGRSEFIDFCIDNLLEGALSEEVVMTGEKAADRRPAPRQAAAAYPPSEDFQQFKRNMGSLMKNLMEIVVNLGLEMDRSRSKGIDELDYLKFQMRKTFGE